MCHQHALSHRCPLSRSHWYYLKRRAYHWHHVRTSHVECWHHTKGKKIGGLEGGRTMSYRKRGRWSCRYLSLLEVAMVVSVRLWVRSSICQCQFADTCTLFVPHLVQRVFLTDEVTGEPCIPVIRTECRHVALQATSHSVPSPLPKWHIQDCKIVFCDFNFPFVWMVAHNHL